MDGKIVFRMISKLDRWVGCTLEIDKNCPGLLYVTVTEVKINAFGEHPPHTHTQLVFNKEGWG
jgi:hypothetical protein